MSSEPFLSLSKSISILSNIYRSRSKFLILDVIKKSTSTANINTVGLKFAYNVLILLFVLCYTTMHLIRVCISKHQFVSSFECHFRSFMEAKLNINFFKQTV